MERATAADYADWAVGMLESGSDSKHLRFLAGMNGCDSAFEAADYFKRAMQELNLVEPAKEDAIRNYAIYCGEQIIKGVITPRDGVKELYGLCIDSDFLAWLMI